MFPSWKVNKWTSENRIVIYCSNNPLRGIGGPMQAIRTEPTNASDVKILLDVDELPRAWYNILPDLPAPFPPYLHPGTKEPVPPQAFEPLFPKELIRQEMSPNRAEPIPEELREAYFRLGRPTPLYRAKRLETYLKTPAHLLQAGGPLPRRIAQTEHRIRPSLLRGPRGGRSPRDRDRRGPMGIRPRPRDELLRTEGEGVHGARVVRSEAVSE